MALQKLTVDLAGRVHPEGLLLKRDRLLDESRGFSAFSHAKRKARELALNLSKLLDWLKGACLSLTALC